ncbi:hypothetical protein M0R88_05955 [Halorussus gelatinilyticus]|uniref:Uncharacterized protein n=1 Tax=Halorussus gelatinilyticus TaxID=2937524 RepID=A0A8U0IKL7_9EURY|nr:hypothetical protein [Halorussus gelatinilyticus]UPW01643.1 hypothetical protein M0R88_05955 [Halorussus gelatinilyticus]
MSELLDAIEDGDEVRWNDRANTATVDGDHYGHPRVETTRGTQYFLRAEDDYDGDIIVRKADPSHQKVAAVTALYVNGRFVLGDGGLE